MNARRPPDTGPRRPRARQHAREHVDEGCPADRRPAVECDRAPALHAAARAHRSARGGPLGPCFGPRGPVGPVGTRRVRCLRVARADFVDERPLDVILAQLTRAARPLAARDGGGEPFRRVARALERRRGGQRHDARRLFALGFDEVFVAVDARGRGNRTLRPGGQQRGAPSGEAGGDGHGRDGVSEVVLAVAERPLAVLPRFAPVNGRERDQHDVVSSADSAPPRVVVERASQFERVTVRRVVVDRRPVGQPGHGSAHDVGFGRVEVAARRVHAQRPPRRLEHLPRRQSQRVPEHVADGGRADRLPAVSRARTPDRMSSVPARSRRRPRRAPGTAGRPARRRTRETGRGCDAQSR